MAQNSASAENEKKKTTPSNLEELWLVNDDPAQLLVQKRLLGRLAATVWDFSSPAALMSQARKFGGCSNLVTDFHMPGMNGLELAQVWCHMHPNARVLVLSASNLTKSEQDEFTYFPSNQVRLLVNFRIPELLATAQEWFGGQTNLSAAMDPVAQELSASLRYFDAQVHSKLIQLGGKDFLHKALQRFADRIPMRLQSFEQAVADCNLDAVYREAHSLKGSSGVVGANQILQCADRMETAAREKQHESVALFLQELTELWQASQVELQEILQGSLE